MSLEVILGSISNYKKYGNSYRFPCPVHNGKGLNMVLSERDGTIAAHCFVCHANGIDLVNKLGLPSSVLFADDNNSEFVERKRPLKEYLDKYSHSVLFISIAENKSHPTWKPLCLDDKRKYRMHKARKENLQKKMLQEYGYSCK